MEFLLPLLFSYQHTFQRRPFGLCQGTVKMSPLNGLIWTEKMSPFVDIKTFRDRPFSHPRRADAHGVCGRSNLALGLLVRGDRSCARDDWAPVCEPWIWVVWEMPGAGALRGQGVQVVLGRSAFRRTGLR